MELIKVNLPQLDLGNDTQPLDQGYRAAHSSI